MKTIRRAPVGTPADPAVEHAREELRRLLAFVVTQDPHQMAAAATKVDMTISSAVKIVGWFRTYVADLRARRVQ